MPWWKVHYGKVINKPLYIERERCWDFPASFFCCSSYRFIRSNHHGCGITCGRYSIYTLIWQCYIWFYHRPYGLKCRIQRQITASICLIWYCPRKLNQILQWWDNFNDLLPNLKNLRYYLFSILAEFRNEYVHEIFQNLIKNN